MAPTRALLAAMAREEFRLQARTFGGRRFGAFPLAVAPLTAGAVWALAATGTPVAETVLGIHVLVFGLGLYTGSVGLVGQDALRGLLGEVTLLVQSARTLPVGERRLLGAFVAKDVGYYAALFLAPIAAALLPVAVLGDRLPAAARVARSGTGAGTAPVALGDVGLLFLSLTATFALGVGTTMLAIAAAFRGRRWRAGLIVVAVGAVALAVLRPAGLDPLAASPHALYAAPLSGGALLGAALSLAVPTAGVLLVDPHAARPSRQGSARFADWRRRLRDREGLLAKSLLDVARSSGGFGKVAFSGAVVTAVSIFLVRTAASVTGRRPAAGIAVGALLGLVGLTTYAWLTQFDGVAEYAALPVPTPVLFGAKLRATLLLAPPTALAGLALAALLEPIGAADFLAGGALAVGVGTYLVGLSALLAGLSPTERLFDPLVYAGFTAGTATVLVPLEIVALVFAPLGPLALGGLAAVGLALGGVGVGFVHLATRRWTARYRSGEF